VFDAFSKWLEVHQIISTTSTATTEKLREIFATHGLPTTVVSHNGTNFTSSEFAEFMKRNGNKLYTSKFQHTTQHQMGKQSVQ
jgi:transposase InsO family protein